MRGWLRLSTWLLGISVASFGILAGALGVDGFFETFSIPYWLRPYLVYALGLLLILICITAAISPAYRIYLKKSTHRYPGYHYLTQCDDKDIAKIATVAGDVFQGATSLEETLQLHRIDNEIFTAVRESGGSLQGYISIIRLNAEGVNAVYNDEFQIKHLTTRHIRRDDLRRDNDLYIGALWGEGPKARSCALYAALGIIRERAPKRVFARAATEQGKHILESYGFKPIKARREGVGEIYVWSRPIA